MKQAIQKLYYSITEVSKILNEEQHVLRYWEREFNQLKPQKNRAGNRVYTLRDLQILKLIKKLLREERYTVAGAKDHLRVSGVLDEIDQANADVHQDLPQAVAQPSLQEITIKHERAQLVVNELRKLAADVRKPTGIGN